MAYIDNSETKRELDEAIRGNAQTNVSPSNIAGQVVPVIDVNPKSFRRANVVKRGTSAATIYTTPTDKDFYLTNISLSASSITVGSNTLVLNVTPFGETSAVSIMRLCVEVSAGVTSANENQCMNLNFPLKLTRGTNISSSVVGTLSNGSVSIVGYTSDV